jgi:hypothetical protein
MLEQEGKEGREDCLPHSSESGVVHSGYWSDFDRKTLPNFTEFYQKLKNQIFLPGVTPVAR